MNNMNHLTIIIKPTVLCNCQCKYCITPKEIPHSRMPLEIVEKLCKSLSASKIYDSSCFIWHGGEPLLMGIDFYESVIKIQTKFFDKRSFINTFQSNCTLINDEWINFFKKYRIRVSTSLDGDQGLHDINRLKNGKGTFVETINNVLKLKQERLLAGVVTVLSKTNIQHIDKIISYFASQNISTRLNPILPCERVDEQEDLSITPNDYAECLINCFDNWIDGKYENGDKIAIAPLTEIIYNMTHPDTPRLCSFSGKCGENFLAINPDGDIYNCGRFCDIDNFKIDNIKNIDVIDDIIGVKKSLIRWKNENEDGGNCKDCEWFSICNKGCPNTSYLYYGEIKDKDPYCSAYKKIFAHIYTRLQKEI